MPGGRERTASPDYAVLAEFLAALAYPVRLELLDALRFPKTLGDIRATAPSGYGGANPDRVLSRATVLGHLEQLADRGLVVVDEVEKGGRPVSRYAANPGRLYALMEDLRRLSIRYAGGAAREDATGTVGQTEQAEDVPGPRLVLVHGVYEGKAWPLRDVATSPGRWTVGRSTRAAVCLDYDPYVSTTHAAIVREADGFAVADLKSKNGTTVNWRPLPQGGSRTLRAGDVVGIGRSRLLFIPT